MMGTLRFGAAMLAELDSLSVPAGAAPRTLECPCMSPGDLVEA